MSVLVWLLILMMMMMAVMKSDAGSAEIIRVSANSSSSVVLPSDLQEGLHRYDIRWTQIPRLLLNRNRSTCSHRRCELLADGSLRFSHVQSQDSGNYTLEVFNEGGQRHMTKHFLLQVKDSSSSSSSPVAAAASVCIVLLVLLLFFIVFFVLRKRRSQRMPTTGHQEANVYMVMKGYQGNEKKDEKSPEKEEEPLYVPCKPAGSCQHEEDVYV